MPHLWWVDESHFINFRVPHQFSWASKLIWSCASWMQKMPGVGIFRIVSILHDLAATAHFCCQRINHRLKLSISWDDPSDAGRPHASWLQIGSVPMIWRGDRCKHGACVSYSDIFSITLGLYMLPTCAVNRWGRRLPLNPLSSWSHEQLKGQPQVVAADASCDTVFCVFKWEDG